MIAMHATNHKPQSYPDPISVHVINSYHSVLVYNISCPCSM